MYRFVFREGLPAALLMANLQPNLRGQATAAVDHPEQLIQSVNGLMLNNTTQSAYTTMFYADYQCETGLLRYANCGHLPGFLFRKDGRVEALASTCTVLGLFEEWQAVTAQNSLAAGDTLLLYTDGVTESFNEAGEEFGEDRLMDAVSKNPELSAQDLAELLAQEVLSHCHPAYVSSRTLQCEGAS